VYCLYDKPAKNRAKEHFEWIVIGLKELEKKLAKLNIPLMLMFGSPGHVLNNLANHTNPMAVVVDFSPLSYPTSWQLKLSESWPVIQVDTHNIIPAWLVSNKQEFSARTIRPKIHKNLSEYLDNLAPQPNKHPIKWPGKVVSINDLTQEIKKIKDSYKSNSTNINQNPGEQAAQLALNDFIYNRLEGYAAERNNPTVDGLSNLSPYLHFGMISSQSVVSSALNTLRLDPSIQQDVDTLIEEMVVRKELSDNYCLYNNNYNSINGAPEWALLTLNKHKNDKREFIYSFKDFEQANTHDRAWNAAQTQLLKSGKIHGYMRMYWAKKVLEWSESPADAHQTLVKLNDFYSVDGGDPNGYVGILWSIAGLHDRPWGERPVYGTVRSMVYNGLKRKFDIEKYIDQNS
jgi:deoxyribodipyrimidine photo-lyase